MRNHIFALQGMDSFTNINESVLETKSIWHELATFHSFPHFHPHFALSFFTHWETHSTCWLRNSTAEWFVQKRRLGFDDQQVCSPLSVHRFKVCTSSVQHAHHLANCLEGFSFLRSEWIFRGHELHSANTEPYGENHSLKLSNTSKMVHPPASQHLPRSSHAVQEAATDFFISFHTSCCLKNSRKIHAKRMSQRHFESPRSFNSIPSSTTNQI